MDIKYQGHERRKEKAREFAEKVIKLYNPPISMSAKDIAEAHTNPRTGKHYSRNHIYIILRKSRNSEL